MKTTLEDKYLLFQLNVEVWLCRYLGSLYIKVPQNDSVGAKNSFPNWTVGITTFIDGNKVHQGVIITWVRYNSRFFVQFGHEITYVGMHLLEVIIFSLCYVRIFRCLRSSLIILIGLLMT